MNLLIFKKMVGRTSHVIAMRQSYCVPRVNEFVALNKDDGSVLVERVEYIITEYESEVWVWVLPS